jgi:hypothetical protein
MTSKGERWYVVQRSEYFDENVLVLEEHVERSKAEQRATWAFGRDNDGNLHAIPITGLTAVSRDEMLRHPPLLRALEAWEAGDDSAFEAEMTALAAVAAAESALE